MKVWIAGFGRHDAEILGIWTTKEGAEAQIAEFRRVDKEQFPQGRYAIDPYVVDEYECDVYLENLTMQLPK